METTSGSSRSLKPIMISRKLRLPRMASSAGTTDSSTEDATLKIRMDSSITTSRKLVPQRGCIRVWTRTFSTVRGSFAS